LFPDLLPDGSEERDAHQGANPLADIHILYRDMQMYGDEKEKMLWDARGMGSTLMSMTLKRLLTSATAGSFFTRRCLVRKKSCPLI
jgi:hypothetical protein